MKFLIFSSFNLTIISKINFLRWACFSWNGPGNIEIVDGIMKKEDYLGIVDRNLMPSAKKLKIKKKDLEYMQDKDPKVSRKHQK